MVDLGRLTRLFAAAAMVTAGWTASASAAIVPAGPAGIGTTFAYDFAQTAFDVNLSATSEWELTDYSTSGSNALWTFDVLVANTTANQAGNNRISIWGFNTTPSASSETAAPAAGWSFEDGNVPGLGDYQLCAKEAGGPNCSGGGGGGLFEGESQLFQFTIKTALANPLEFTSLFVRYQAVGANGDSIAFTGTERSPEVDPRVIPLPAAAWLLLGGLGGLGLVSRRRKAAAA